MTVLNFEQIKKIDNLDNNYCVNCWGSTLNALNVTSKLEWVDLSQIKEFIDNDTIHTDNFDVGTILVMYGNEYCGSSYVIIHTAIYLGNDVWWHKAGSLASEHCTIENIFDIYENEFVNCEFKKVA